MQIKLLLALPFILFFSYYPIIPLGSTENMNLELSLPLIWLALYALVSIPKFPKKPLLALFPAYLLISLIWSANPLRTFLTTGIVACLIVSVCTFPGLLKTHKDLKKQLMTSLLLASVLASIFCWLQCIFDVAGLSRDVTLLCQGCTYQAFGFPHPNGFAIEPQFMGSLLLAPIALSFYLLFTAIEKQKRRRYLLLSLFLTTTLFLIFSRGAIYSFLAAVAVAITALIVKQPKREKVKPLLALPIIVVSFLTALLAQGIFAELAPTNDNFGTAIAKSVHQLSLGKIDFRPASSTETNQQSAEPSSDDNSGVSEPAEESRFSGYVAESTDYRLSLNEIAFKTWTKDAKNIFMGVGLGAAGPAMYEVEPSLGSPKEIVQNEYVSLLLEVGIFGIIALALTVYAIFKFIKAPSKAPTLKTIFLGALALSFLLSLNFFSGLPNALHIYLLLPLGLAMISTVTAKH